MSCGSAGVLFGLYKYSLLLDKETGGLGPDWLDEILKQAVPENCDISDDVFKEK